jgi:hypothetical protein
VSVRQVVYVLVSSAADYIAEMAMVSATALRMVSPGVRAIVVSDPMTVRGLAGHRAKLRGLVDEIIECEAFDENQLTRSRRLKTSLRNRIHGDYLFIDVDAVPVKPIDDVFVVSAELAAAQDAGVNFGQFAFHEFEKEAFIKMGWELPTGRYFNSGVMFVRDTVSTRKLYEEWHRIWQETVARGLFKDQPPLHRALVHQRFNPQRLDPQWNALIGMSSAGVKGARIMHFSTIRFDQRDDTVFHRVVKDVKQSGKVDVDALREVMVTGYPWTNKDSIRLRYAVGDYTGALTAAARRSMRMLSARKNGQAGRGRSKT